GSAAAAGRATGSPRRTGKGRQTDRFAADTQQIRDEARRESRLSGSHTICRRQYDPKTWAVVIEVADQEQRARDKFYRDSGSLFLAIWVYIQRVSGNSITYPHSTTTDDMPCTPTGLSHSYISRWADLTVPSSLDAMPSLDPIPSPARGRGRTRRSRKDENESDEHQPNRQRQGTCSPHPPVTRVTPCNARTRAMASRRPAAMPNPTLSFRRLAHKQPPPAQTIPRVPSDVTNKPAKSTPSPDLIFTMSPVLGLDGLTTHRPSRLSAELDVRSSTHGSWDQPPPPYSTSHATTSAVLADESSASVIDDLVADSMIIPMRLHAKSDPLPACLSSVASTSADTTPARPIPIPKPSPRVPSDYGGVSSVSVSVSLPKFARVPRRRGCKQDENVPLPLSVVEEPADVTGEWCGTADAVPVPATQRPPPRKKFFIPGPGESYDGDMDSEFSSWR
ncbi:hypothetical protein FRC11_004162, partial [Ceratobasidium sp. 423]